MAYYNWKVSARIPAAMKSLMPQMKAVCHACARMHGKDLLAAGDGNVSLRLPDGGFLMTPSGVSKAALLPSQMVLLDSDGRAVSGKPSSELAMHMAIYRTCPRAMAVVHAHPPTAIAWTVARPDLEELPSDILPEVILAAGTIPVVPFALPGTPDMGEVLEPFLPAHRLLILPRHGAVAWGEDLDEAACGIERLEHVARILMLAVTLGGLTSMTQEAFDSLKRTRALLGPRLR
jgi:L-fuculose-phosphate aldolase